MDEYAKKKQDILYHLARVAFNAGRTSPWYMAVHAIRQGVGIDDYKLTESNCELYPDLKELIDQLQKAMKEI